MNQIQLTLFDCEQEIERALESMDAAWLRVAMSLRTIKESGLYKPSTARSSATAGNAG